MPTLENVYLGLFSFLISLFVLFCFSLSFWVVWVPHIFWIFGYSLVTGYLACKYFLCSLIFWWFPLLLIYRILVLLLDLRKRKIIPRILWAPQFIHLPLFFPWMVTKNKYIFSKSLKQKLTYTQSGVYFVLLTIIILVWVWIKKEKSLNLANSQFRNITA